MLVADVASFIYDEQGGNTPQFEKIPFLPVQVSNPVLGVGQAEVGEVVLAPVAAVGVGSIGTDGKDFRVTRGEGRVIVAQAREMGAAVRSHEAAQESQDEVVFAFEISKADEFAAEIGQFKVGGRGVSHQCPVISEQS